MNLEAMKQLRDVVFPRVFIKNIFGMVDLDKYARKGACGTYCCVKGEYARMVMGIKGEMAIHTWCRKDITNFKVIGRTAHFDIELYEASRIFGGRRGGLTLDHQCVFFQVDAVWRESMMAPRSDPVARNPPRLLMWDAWPILKIVQKCPS